jgi:hypothetical protein
MNNTATQGLASFLFLIGFVLAGAGFAFGGGALIPGLLGVAALAVSCLLFRKAKGEVAEG